MFPISEMKIKKLTTKEIVKIERKSILERLNLDIEINICLIIFAKFIWNLIF